MKPLLTQMLSARPLFTSTLTKRSRGDLARPEGFEPPTTAFGGRYSIQLSYGRVLARLSMGNRRVWQWSRDGGASITQAFGMDFVATAILIFTWERSDHFPLMVPFDKLRTGSAHHERKMIRPSQASFACAALPQVELPSAG